MMVKIIFYNLIRSKYQISEMEVNPGSISSIIKQILDTHPQMSQKDFDSSVVFYKGSPIHFHGFSKEIEDFDEIIITHFVGGG